jgi:hypothetical protein
MRMRSKAPAAFALGLVLAAPAHADPARTLQDMQAQMSRCLASVRVAPGTDVTVLFMLNRRGGLIGKPRLTHAHWAGDDAARKASAASISEGLDHCLPLSISDELGALMAGHMYTYRFQAPARREDGT